MRGLRTPQPGRGPARRRAAVPELPTSPDPGLRALPGLQEQLATEPEALPALRPGPEDPRAPRRSGRRRPPRPGSAAPRPVRRRAARYGPGLDGPAQGARAPQRARQPDPSADQRDPRR